MPNDKLDKIEEMKAKLFNKNYQVRSQYHSDFTFKNKNEVPDSWKKEELKENVVKKIFLKTSIFKKFFIFSIGFFVLALGYAAYTFFIGGNSVSNNNIDITVLGNAFVAGGEDLPLQVQIINKNNSALQLADLVVSYPKNSNTGSSSDNKILRTSIGTIPAGGTVNENIKFILFGEQESVQTIKISLEYRVESSNAIFVKEVPYQVTINSTPINLSVDAPDQANPNQEISLNIKAILNATKTVSGILLRVDYPIGFEFESANPKPSFGNNIWSLGDLAPGAEKNISIIGKMVDVFDGEEKNFNVFSGSESPSDKSMIGTVFNSLSHMIAIKKAFLEANLYINGVYQREYAVDAKTTISGDIRWANNLDTRISNLVITAKLSGNALNRKTINSPDGFYDSSKDTITWDKNTKSDFQDINPGDSGSVSFSVSPSSLFSDSSGILKEPVINIDVSIKGSNTLEGSGSLIINNQQSKIVRVISDAGLAAKALYFSGPFTNTGPIPPKVGENTTYTVVWNISNTSNNISKAQVTATLPSWMSFVGSISPSTEDLTYNSATKQIIWNIGGIPSGTGIITTSREASFQVSINPSLSQVGNSPLLINGAVLTGHDDFANVDITVNKSSLSTQLYSDSNFPQNGDRVIE